MTTPEPPAPPCMQRKWVRTCHTHGATAHTGLSSCARLPTATDAGSPAAVPLGAPPRPPAASLAVAATACRGWSGPPWAATGVAAGRHAGARPGSTQRAAPPLPVVLVRRFLQGMDELVALPGIWTGRDSNQNPLQRTTPRTDRGRQLGHSYCRGRPHCVRVCMFDCVCARVCACVMWHALM